MWDGLKYSQTSKSKTIYNEISIRRITEGLGGLLMFKLKIQNMKSEMSWNKVIIRLLYHEIHAQVWRNIFNKIFPFSRIIRSKIPCNDSHKVLGHRGCLELNVCICFLI